MLKRISLACMLVLLAAMMVLGNASAGAEAMPQYLGTECYLSPASASIASGGVVTFNAEWYDGMSDTYRVQMSYGDGSSESLALTTATYHTFVHVYPQASPGTTWQATLTVTNGNTAYAQSTITIR